MNDAPHASPRLEQEARDRAGFVALIASLLKMGAHIAGNKYEPSEAVREACQLYDEVRKQTGIAPGKAF